MRYYAYARVKFPVTDTHVLHISSHVAVSPGNRDPPLLVEYSTKSSGSLCPGETATWLEICKTCVSLRGNVNEPLVLLFFLPCYSLWSINHGPCTDHSSPSYILACCLHLLPVVFKPVASTSFSRTIFHEYFARPVSLCCSLAVYFNVCLAMRSSFCLNMYPSQLHLLFLFRLQHNCPTTVHIDHI